MWYIFVVIVIIIMIIVMITQCRKFWYKPNIYNALLLAIIFFLLWIDCFDLYCIHMGRKRNISNGENILILFVIVIFFFLIFITR